MSDLMTRVTSGIDPAQVTYGTQFPSKRQRADLADRELGPPFSSCSFETCANLPLQCWLLLKCCLQPL